jgi:hypothetical protein
VEKATFGPKLEQDARLLALAKKGSQQLEEVVGNSAPPVTAEWDRAEDARGRPLLTLRLSDSTGWVTTTFEPDELRDAEHTWIRLHLLWGDLLRVRSKKQLEALLSADSGPGD